MQITTKVAAEILGLSSGQVAELCRGGKLEATKHGPLWSINPTSVTDYKSIQKPKRRPRRNSSKKSTRYPLKRIDIENVSVIFKEIQLIDNLIDLEKHLTSSNPLEVLFASIPIRNLLIGNPPLVAQANPNYHNEIRFIIGDTLPRSTIENRSTSTNLMVQDSLNPESALTTDDIREVSLDEFLNTVILITEGRRFSIGQIILLEASILENIKLEEINIKREQLITKVHQFLSPGGISAIIRQLKAIGGVVISAHESFLTGLASPSEESSNFQRLQTNEVVKLE